MPNLPLIKTAIPKRRYQIGDFGATLLGEIESGDARRFRLILAFVPNGQREPTLYVCAEESDGPAGPEGCCHLRVINEVLDEILDTDAGWADLDRFAEQALAVGGQVLGLQQESVVRLL